MSEMLKDSDWKVVEGEPCRVIEFIPWAKVENGKVVAPSKTEPYVSVVLECKQLDQNTTGFITHKLDFQHLWSAFRERGVRPDEEVIIFWSRRYLKGFSKFLSPAMPKLWVMICQKGAFELMSDKNHKPELTGEARWNAEKPIAEWKPEVMK